MHSHPWRANTGALGALAVFAAFLPFAQSLKSLAATWWGDPQFSYGLIVPVVVAALIWARRKPIRESMNVGWTPAVLLVAAFSALQVLSARSGSLLLTGLALTGTILSTIAFLWGVQCMRVIFAPVSLLIFMVPLPPYLVGSIAWHLQGIASTASAMTLRFLGIPTLLDGNLLRLSSYVLEVKEACSGSRSVFALITLACILGVTNERRHLTRFLLLCAAPLFAVSTNVLRIVITGLIASRWGDLAGQESLHAIWGVLMFLVAVAGLLGLQRTFQ